MINLAEGRASWRSEVNAVSICEGIERRNSIALSKDTVILQEDV